VTEEGYILDASALLAMLGGERGGDIVATVISASMISAVNWSEVVQKARAHGVDISGLREDLESLGLAIEPFHRDEAEAAADLWHRGARSLALGDRACLATGMLLGRPVLTADRAWAATDTGAEVRVIR
jgi:PIN domain nuclease of toxin-antitoxin system